VAAMVTTADFMRAYTAVNNSGLAFLQLKKVKQCLAFLKKSHHLSFRGHIICS
jgi:hypothetical protein